jgi:hypothetical protein
MKVMAFFLCQTHNFSFSDDVFLERFCWIGLFFVLSTENDFEVFEWTGVGLDKALLHLSERALSELI